MNENLNDLLNEYEGTTTIPEETIQETVEEVVVNGIISENEPQTTETTNNNLYLINEASRLNLINLPDWVDKYYHNHNAFSPTDGIRCPRTVISGVDAKENLLFTVPHPAGGVDANGATKREVRMMYGTLSMFVPDLPPEKISVYKNNSAYILQRLSENIYIKCYVLKTGSILMYCYKHDEIIMPYYNEKIKKKSSMDIPVPEPNINNIISRFSSELENSDYENIVLFYRQISKSNLSQI
jgi:hypothetical protein